MSPKTRNDNRSIIVWAILLVCIIGIGAGIIATTMCSSDQAVQEEAAKTNPTQMNDAGAESTSAGTSQDSASAASAADVAAQKAEQREQEQEAEEAPLGKYTVCIDAGHGAHPDSTPSPNNPDSGISVGIATEPGGTSGSKSGPEYKICLEVAKMLEEELEKHGIEVVQVRTSNDVTISPKERALVANKCKADSFIRLHCDSAGSTNEGFYTLVPADTGYQADGDLYKKSQKMGKRMHKFIVDALGAQDRGVTVREDQGGFNWCKRPAVLFEMANLDDPDDDERMSTKSYKKKVAKAISDATVDYLESLE